MKRLPRIGRARRLVAPLLALAVFGAPSADDPRSGWAGPWFASAASAQADDDWGVDGGADRRDEIIRRYRMILDRRPDEGPIFDRLLQELGGGRRFESTLEDYRSLAAENPENFAYHMILGHLLKHAERLDEAAAAYSAAIEAAPEDARGHQSLGGVYRSLDRRDEASAEFETALELAADDDARREILRQLADLSFEAREWDEAGAYVERLIEIDPRDIYTRMELAEIFIRYERFDDALLQYETIIDFSGGDTRQRAIAMKDAGDTLALMGRTDEALDRYHRALRLVDEGYWLARELEQRIIAAYRQEDRLEELVAEYEAEWSRPSVRQLNLLASLYDELGREDESIDAYRRALRRDSRSLDTRMALIRVLERRGDMTEVVDQYLELIRHDRTDASIRFRLVDVYRRLGRRDDAVAVLDGMARQFGDRPHVLIDIADRYVRFGEDDKALAAYERLVRIDGGEPDNYIALGEFHFMQGHRSEAERTWRRVLDVISDAGEAHALLGNVYADHGLLEEAIIEFEAARIANPDDDMYLRSLAKAYDDSRQLPESLDLWEELLERTDQAHLRAESRDAMIRIYTALGRLQDVLPDYRERFEADPPDIEAGYFLGEAMMALESSDRAEEVFAAILVHDDADLTALLALEGIYTTNHQHSEAIDILVRIAEAHPQRAREYYHRLAELSLRIYDDSEAVRFAQLAVELNPDNAQAHARLGEIYRQMQRLDDSVLAYRQALLLDQRAFAYYFDLAEIFLALDRPRDADELYQTVLAGANDEVYILRAGRRSIQINQATDTLDTLVGLLEPHLYEEDTGETYLKLLVELYDRLTMPLIQMAEYGIGDERERASARLEEVGRRALRPLLDALAGDDISVRRSALRILAAQRNPNAALPIARLMDASDSDLRMEAALAVARIADERAIAPVLRAANGSGDSAELLAVWALARMGSLEASGPLTEIASDPGRVANARALAVLGLGNLPPDDARAGTIAAALSDESPSVQVAALRAIGILGLDQFGDEVRLRLEHGREAVPLAAAWALGALPPTRATVEALADAYVFGASDIRAYAGHALARLGRGGVDTAAVNHYDQSLAFYDREHNAFDVPGYLDGLLSWSLVAVDAGAPAVLDDYEAVLSAAVARGLAADGHTRTALLRELDADANGLTLGAITSGMSGAALDAHNALARSVASGSVPRLTELGDDPDREIRARALSVLAKLEDPTAAAVLVAHLDDAAVEVAVAAVRGLGRVDHGAHTDRLVGLLRSESWRVRAAAAEALARSGAASATDALIAAAGSDDYTSVRAAALVALLRLAPELGVRSAVDGWLTLPVSVRMELLGEAGRLDPAPSALLELGAADSDPRVRRAARNLVD